MQTKEKGREGDKLYPNLDFNPLILWAENAERARWLEEAEETERRKERGRDVSI